MTPNRFEYLLQLLAPCIGKRTTKFREPISAAQWLALTLQYLATGESQQSLSLGYRTGKATVTKIVSETALAIYNSLRDSFVKVPSLKEGWLNISVGFEKSLNFLHCIGSIDCKHIWTECPKMTGMYYFNYKCFYSIVLLAICDSNHCSTLFDLGQCGSNYDSGVLANSKMKEMIEENRLDILPPSTYKSCDFDPLPYFFVGDEIFPLKTCLMRPYPWKLDKEQMILNYSLSRARRTIENAFGILSACWRIFHTIIRANIEYIEKYVLACLCLHNYLRLTDNAFYCQAGFVDSFEETGNLKQVEWRGWVIGNKGLLPLNHVKKGLAIRIKQRKWETLF